jgi:hypothetical protein
MLEGFTTSYDFEKKDYRRNPATWDDASLRNVDKYVLPLREKHKFQVVVLDYARPEQAELIQAAADRAASFGFLHAVAPVALDDVYTNRVTARPDAKWRKPQMTPEKMALTLDSERNGFPAGTTVVPSGCSLGYTVAPLVDGVADHTNVDWSRAAWASAEDGKPGWVEVRLPQPRRGGTLRVDWQPDHGPRAFVVETRASKDDEWKTISRAADNEKAASASPLPNESYQFIRVTQQPGGGSAARPDLMWISHLSLLP